MLKGLSELASKYDGFILDQYGVMHNGGLPLDGAAACLTSLLAAGKIIVINSNSSSTASDTRKRLVEKHQLPMLEGCAVVTSGTQTLDTIVQRGWTGKKVSQFCGGFVLIMCTPPRPLACLSDFDT